MSKAEVTEIELNGVAYVRKDSVKTEQIRSGTRAVVVVDRGWIFAGDVTRENGRLRLNRAIHVLSWKQNGFSGLCEDPKTAGANMKPCPPVDMPADAELFCVPVGDSWGL